MASTTKITAWHDALQRMFVDGELNKISGEDPASEVREQFLREYPQHWPPLWLRCRAGKGSDDGQNIVVIAPDTTEVAAESVRGVPLLLDTTSDPWVLTLVLREWSEHVLDIGALEGWGLSSQSRSAKQWMRFVKAIEEAATEELPDGEIRRRWRCRFNRESKQLLVDTSAENDVTQLVGRLPLEGGWPWDADGVSGRVDVVLLPRLSSGKPLGTRQKGALIVYPQELEGEKCAVFSPIAPVAAAGFQAMLRLAARIDIDWRTGTTFSPVDATFSALALVPLISGLETAAQSLRYEYHRRRQTRRAPSGTVRISAYAGKIARARPDLVPVHRFERTVDHLENRFYRGICRLVRLQLIHDSSGLAEQLRHRLRSVEPVFGASQYHHPTVADADRLLRDARLGDERQKVVELCRRTLLGRFPGLDADGKERTPGQAFEVSIPDLFEEAVRASLEQALRWHFVHPDDVMRGEHSHRMSWQRDHLSRPWLKPDLFAVSGKRVLLLGDAKYKRVQKPTWNRANVSFAPLRREDFHQLSTYADAWPDAEQMVVIYPETGLDDPRGKAATTHVETLSRGDGRSLGVFTFAPERWQDVPLSDEPITQFLSRHGQGAAYP